MGCRSSTALDKYLAARGAGPGAKRYTNDLDENLDNLGDGRTTFAGTSLPDYDAYVFVEKFPAGQGADNPVRELDAVLDPQSLVPDGPDDPPGVELLAGPSITLR